MSHLIFALAIGPTVLTVVGLGGLIFFHELGHFIACRLTGTRVEAFSIGFGKELIGWTRGPTRYKICLIPLGGYVKMAAENPGEARTNAPDEFPNKSFSARLFIMSNGVIFNFILAFLLFVVAFRGPGVRFNRAEVGAVEPGSPAAAAGLQPGDVIKRIGATDILSFDDAQQEIALSSGETPFTIERGGEERTFAIAPRFDERRGFYRVGIAPAMVVATVADGSPAAKAGIETGEAIVGVNGVSTPTALPYIQMAVESAAVGTPDDRPVDLSLTVRGADGAERTVQLTVPRSDRPHLGVMNAAGSRIREVEGDLKESFQPGDVLVGANGADVADFIELMTHPLRPVREVVVRREDMLVRVKLTDADAMTLSDALTFEAPPENQVHVPDGPARRAGLRSGDRITRIDDREIETWDEAREAIGASEERLSVTVSRGGETHTFEITPGRAFGFQGVGVQLGGKLAPVQAGTLGAAAVLGWQRTVGLGKTVVLTLRSLLTAEVSHKRVGGPIMLATVTYGIQEKGFGYYLYLLALISINLAVLNLLPIPILDGGQIVLLCAEKLRGKPLPERFVGYYQMVGLVLILGLMILAISNDFRNIVFG